jgi:predicted neuraminidase
VQARECPYINYTERKYRADVPKSRTEMRHEFVFENAPVPSCHASTLADCGPAGLLCAWFAGKEEGAPDVAIWSSHRTNDRWSPPRKIAAAPEVPCWNPVLHVAPSGELLLFYKAGPSPQTWTGFLQRSRDQGQTWSAPEQLPAGILGPIKNKPFEMADGTLVCGSSVESWRAWGCWVEITTDLGRTWTKHGPINQPGHLYGSIQPAVFGGKDGKLAMLCRTRDVHRIVRATSNDGGKSWSALAEIELPQNNSGLDAVQLRDGRVVLIYNHTTRGRTPLNVGISRDLGQTWSQGPVLEQEPGEYSYPVVIEGKDGTVHISYTWKRQRVRYASFSPNELK